MSGSRPHGAWLGGALACAVGLATLAAGCGSNRIDPPRRGEETTAEEAPVDVDSLAVWAERARQAWASGDSLRADVAAALARDVFAGAWSTGADEAAGAREGERRERLPVSEGSTAPTPERLRDALARLGLTADVRVAEGPVPLWQVIVSDPVGSAGAETEFWAWPDPAAPDGAPILQALPADAPARANYGPDAAGALLTWSRGPEAGLASAWSRPRGRLGLEVALARRSGEGRDARWRVEVSRILPVEVDSVAFLPDPNGAPPALLVLGAGARDALFDDCPSCPRLTRRQRYEFRDAGWVLVEETIQPSPYAAFVAFLHAMVNGLPDGALPYASGPDVIHQAQALGLDRRPVRPLRASPGITADDPVQRFRLGGNDAVEVTFESRGDRWVVADLRRVQVAIE